MDSKQIDIEISNFLDKREFNNCYERCCILSGPWGIGKSFLINQIAERRNGIDNYIHISLFGINNVIDLKDRVIKELSSFFSKPLKALKILLSAVSLNFGFGAGSVTVDLSKLTDAFNDEKICKRSLGKKPFVVIIDDIERKDYKLSIVELLGATEELIRNENIKVILITNYDKFKLNKECLEFKEFKERIANQTFNLNQNYEVASDLLGDQYDFIKRSSNLRTIIRYKEIMDYINSLNISYPRIIQKIIYNTLRYDKEKIDLYGAEVERRLKTFPNTDKVLVKQITEEVSELDFITVLSSFCVSKQDYVDGEKVYNSTNLTTIVGYIYHAITEGDVNKLLSIPRPEFDIYLDVLPEVNKHKEDSNNITLTKTVLDMFNEAFLKNTTHQYETVCQFCDFLYDNYSRYSSNESVHSKFNVVYKNCVKVVMEYVFKKSNHYHDLEYYLKKNAKNVQTNKWVPKLLNYIKRHLLDELLKLKFDSFKHFETNINKFESVPQALIDSDFFTYFHNGNKKNIFDGVNFIFKQCEKDVSGSNWDLFKRYFHVIQIMQLSVEMKKRVREMIGEKDSVANSKMNELLMELH